jgi:transcriptional antiterminator NusG
MTKEQVIEEVPEVAEAATSDAVDATDEAVEEAAPAFVNPNWKWYVVHTYSGYENRARQAMADRVVHEGLDEMFGEILMPTESVVEMKKGAKRTTTRKFFPGYLLVQMEMTDETWHLVKNTQKVTGFVGGSARRPTPIPEREVTRITDRMKEGVEKPKPRQDFEEGDQVRVTDGPFMNFTGTVEAVRPEKQKLRVLVSIFGRATPVELDFIQVESV